MAKSRTNFIKINGRLYDAATGKPAVMEAAASAPKSLDGFIPVRTPGDAKPKPKPVKVKSAPKISVQKAQSKLRVDNSKPAKSVHSKPQKSTTLNRQATHKPKTAKKQVSGVALPPKMEVTRHIEGVIPEKVKLTGNVKPEKLSRAQAAQKSRSVAKFPFPTKASVRPEPVTEPTPQPAPEPSLKDRLIAEQMSQIQPEDTPPKAKFKLFGRQPKFATVTALTLGTLVLIGYITYINIPNMALRVAAREAGFSAQMPSYKPSGFAFTGPITYKPGEIAISFKANTDGRTFTVTERKTNWDSLSLRDNFVGGHIDRCSTYQERGLTIYICDGNEATWVNGGIWYTISGDAKFSSEQLLKIASSL